MTVIRLPPDFWAFLRFLIGGGWNTLFGVGLYAVFYAWLDERIHYLVLMIPVQIVAISQAFLCYKFLVFKVHKTNWFREYLRCFIVYGVSAALTTLLLWVCVEWMRLSPIWGNCLSTIVVTIVSFVGHRCFTFRCKVASPSCS